jgi:hypothetical protein
VGEKENRPVVFSGQSLGLPDVAGPADFVDLPFTRGRFKFLDAFFHPGEVASARLQVRGSRVQDGKSGGHRENNPGPTIHTFLESATSNCRKACGLSNNASAASCYNTDEWPYRVRIFEQLVRRSSLKIQGRMNRLTPMAVIPA